jgi:hypothetical protein
MIATLEPTGVAQSKPLVELRNTILPGTELVFPIAGAQRKARCNEVERSSVVLEIEGQKDALRLAL